MSKQFKVVFQYRARAIPGNTIRVTEGVGRGDTLGCAAEMTLGDRYMFKTEATQHPLLISTGLGDGVFRISQGSDHGASGNSLHADSRVTLMSEAAELVEALVLVETNDGFIEQTYLVPLTPVATEASYELIDIDRSDAAQRLLAESTRLLPDLDAEVANSTRRPLTVVETGQTPA
jgi:hypothetical protein